MSARRVRLTTVTARLDQLFDGLPETMTVQEVADVLRMHTKGVYRWIREGIIPAYKLGATWFIVRDELKDAMRQGSNLSRRVEKTAGLDPADDGGQGN
jgi:excisionase family DNA binding protein